MPEIVGRDRPPRLSAPPASPALGETYYDTGLNQLLYWNGTSWVGGGSRPWTFITTYSSRTAAAGQSIAIGSTGCVISLPAGANTSDQVQVHNDNASATAQVLPDPASRIMLYSTLLAVGAALTLPGRTTVTLIYNASNGIWYVTDTGTDWTSPVVPSSAAGGDLGGSYPNPTVPLLAALGAQVPVQVANNSAQNTTSGGGVFVINTFSAFGSPNTWITASAGGLGINTAGLYLFTAWAMPLAGSSTGQTNVYISHRGVGGTVLEDLVIFEHANNIAGPNIYQGTQFMQMAAGDYATIGFAQNGGSNMTMGTSNILRGVRIA